MALNRESLIQYMHERFGVDPADVTDATPLFSSSLLDSFSIVEMMMFIETEAGIRMDAWDVTLDNLDSIERILAYVQHKRSG